MQHVVGKPGDLRSYAERDAPSPRSAAALRSPAEPANRHEHPATMQHILGISETYGRTRPVIQINGCEAHRFPLICLPELLPGSCLFGSNMAPAARVGRRRGTRSFIFRRQPECVAVMDLPQHGPDEPGGPDGAQRHPKARERQGGRLCAGYPRNPSSRRHIDGRHCRGPEQSRVSPPCLRLTWERPVAAMRSEK